MHGGFLEVWSEKGLGSNFRLTVPRHEDITDYMSPLPLIPEEIADGAKNRDTTGGWLRRPFRRSIRAPKEGKA